MELVDYVKPALFVLGFLLLVMVFLFLVAAWAYARDLDAKPSIEDLTFDTTGFEQGDQTPTSRAWAKSDGDASRMVEQCYMSRTFPYLSTHITM